MSNLNLGIFKKDVLKISIKAKLSIGIKPVGLISYRRPARHLLRLQAPLSQFENLPRLDFYAVNTVDGEKTYDGRKRCYQSKLGDILLDKQLTSRGSKRKNIPIPKPFIVERTCSNVLTSTLQCSGVSWSVREDK